LKVCRAKLLCRNIADAIARYSFGLLRDIDKAKINISLWKRRSGHRGGDAVGIYNVNADISSA